MEQHLIPTSEACTILNINRSTLGRWITAGKLAPALKLPGRTQPMFFDRARIEALRDSREIPA